MASQQDSSIETQLKGIPLNNEAAENSEETYSHQASTRPN